MKKTKKLIAILGIILLVGLYLSSLVFAFMDNALGFRLLLVSIFCTVAFPALLYICNMLYKLLSKEKSCKK